MQRLFRLAVVAVALAAAVACGSWAQFPVPGVITVPEGGFADLSVTIPAGAAVTWTVTPDPTQEAEGLADGRLIFGGKKGVTYTATAVVTSVDWDKKKVISTKAKFTVAFAGDSPKPDPKPDPGPGPNPPTPGGKVSRFVIVEDTLKSGAWRGDLFGSARFAAFYKAFQGTRTVPVHRVIDTNLEAGEQDAEATRFLGLAKGKELPYLFLLDDAGAVVKDAKCETVDTAFIAQFDVHVGERQLGLIVAPPRLAWTPYGSDPGTPIIPRAQWKEVDLKAWLPPVHDQDGRGQCASSAACNVLEASRNLAGLPYVYFSAGDLYSRVNGGRDQGSLLEDNLAELVKNGVCTAASRAYVWDGKSAPASLAAERAKYKVAEVYQCQNFDALASALQMGFIGEYGMMWYNGYKVDPTGWLYGTKTGGGGHALTAYGLKKRADGTWGLLTRNTWGTSWGGSKDGTIGPGNHITPESFVNGQIGGFFAVRAVNQVGRRPAREPFTMWPDFTLAP